MEKEFIEISCRQKLMLSWLDMYSNWDRMTTWEMQLVQCLRHVGEDAISHKQAVKLEEIYSKIRGLDSHIKFRIVIPTLKWSSHV